MTWSSEGPATTPSTAATATIVSTARRRRTPSKEGRGGTAAVPRARRTARRGRSRTADRTPSSHGPYHRCVRLEPLYTVAFTYPEGWSVELRGEHGVEWQDLYIAEGTCSGRLVGRIRGANHPRRRVDGTFCPEFQGVIE